MFRPTNMLQKMLVGTAVLVVLSGCVSGARVAALNDRAVAASVVGMSLAEVHDQFGEPESVEEVDNATQYLYYSGLGDIRRNRQMTWLKIEKGQVVGVGEPIMVVQKGRVLPAFSVAKRSF